MELLVTYIPLAIVVLILGVTAGNYMRKYNRKHYCPHCNCRENCNIGHTVEASDEIKGCYLCGKGSK